MMVSAGQVVCLQAAECTPSFDWVERDNSFNMDVSQKPFMHSSALITVIIAFDVGWHPFVWHSN